MSTVYGKTALVGYTGFVGSVLANARAFDKVFNSKNIQDIAGQKFDTIVCAGAPASMWNANQNPSGDRANLAKLASALIAAQADRIVLVSTIAVFDDISAGYTESSARYEQKRAYGWHRHELEVTLADHFPRLHILRLPALFGRGLKKNFIFDLINPLPSFLTAEKYAEAQRAVAMEEADGLGTLYCFDTALKMWRLDREALQSTQGIDSIYDAFERAHLVARNFTNSRSRFQYYNIARLANDMDLVLDHALPVINFCSEPIVASEICAELTGREFVNDVPPLVEEDVRSEYAALFGLRGPYLFDRIAVMKDLKAFHATETGR